MMPPSQPKGKENEVRNTLPPLQERRKMADRRDQSRAQAQASDTRKDRDQVQTQDDGSLRQRERREPLPPQRKGPQWDLLGSRLS